MSVVPRLMICPSSTTCLVRRHGSFWCLLLQILMISWMSWGVEVDVDCLGGSYIFHHVWNMFLCRSWKLMYDDVCRYSVPYLCCKFVYSFLQCALHEDLNMPIICHYRGCFQYTVHSDLVQPLSAAALSSNLEKQVMTHASHRFIARQCIFMYSSLTWRWNAGMFERMDMDGYCTFFWASFFSIKYCQKLSQKLNYPDFCPTNKHDSLNLLNEWFKLKHISNIFRSWLYPALPRFSGQFLPKFNFLPPGKPCAWPRMRSWRFSASGRVEAGEPRGWFRADIRTTLSIKNGGLWID